MAIPFDVDATWLNATASYDAGELRRADGALVAGASGQPWGGIARHSDTAMNVTVNGSDVVTVNPGSVVIPGNAVAETGIYRASLSTAITGTLAARHSTNPRITLVVFQARDTEVVVGHGAYKGRIAFIDGSPGAVPVAPGPGDMAVELARITVPQVGGGAASVDLTYRTFATAAGGELIVPTFARLPASAAKWQRARALDTGRPYIWPGSAPWVEVGGWLSPGINTPNLPSTGTLRYAINDRTVSVRAVASVSGAALNTIYLTLPVAMTGAFGFGLEALGTALATEGGGGSYPGIVMPDTANRVKFMSAEPAAANWGPTAPFTWGNTDILTAAFSYEMA